MLTLLSQGAEGVGVELEGRLRRPDGAEGCVVNGRMGGRSVGVLYVCSRSERPSVGKKLESYFKVVPWLLDCAA
jgi:hypothetical protein